MSKDRARNWWGAAWVEKMERLAERFFTTHQGLRTAVELLVGARDLSGKEY